MPGEPTERPAPTDDDPLADEQARFGASLDRAQRMLERMNEVLAPLDTLPDLGAAADDSGATRLETAAARLAEPPPPEGSNIEGAAPEPGGAAIAVVDDAALSAPSRTSASEAAEPLRPRRRVTSPVSGGAPSGVVSFLQHQIDQRLDTPLVNFLDRQQRSRASSRLEDFARAVTAETSVSAADAGPTGVRRDARRGSRVGSVTRGSGGDNPTTAPDDSPIRVGSSNRSNARATIPRLNLPGGAGPSRRSRAENDSEKLLNELKEGQQQLLRDVSKLKRKPAVWGEGR